MFYEVELVVLSHYYSLFSSTRYAGCGDFSGKTFAIRRVHVLLVKLEDDVPFAFSFPPNAPKSGVKSLPMWIPASVFHWSMSG